MQITVQYKLICIIKDLNKNITYAPIISLYKYIKELILISLFSILLSIQIKRLISIHTYQTIVDIIRPHESFIAFLMYNHC